MQLAQADGSVVKPTLSPCNPCLDLLNIQLDLLDSQLENITYYISEMIYVTNNASGVIAGPCPLLKIRESEQVTLHEILVA